jgi:peroxiredoxin
VVRRSLRFAIALALVGGFVLSPAVGRATTVTVGQPPPAFELRDENGTVYRMADYAGRPTLVYFTHNACHYCTQVIGFLKRAHEAHADQGLAILTINVMANGGELIRRYKEQFNLPFAMLAGKSPSLLRDYEVNYVPILVFIDRRGIVVRIDHHYILPEEFDASVTQIVTGK